MKGWGLSQALTPGSWVLQRLPGQIRAAIPRKTTLLSDLPEPLPTGMSTCLGPDHWDPRFSLKGGGVFWDRKAHSSVSRKTLRDHLASCTPMRAFKGSGAQ